jgi:hypothetical protein
MTELSKERCRCKESFYWNLTQPYFQFEEGEYYMVLVRQHEEGVKIYSFDFCNWIGTHANFTKHFDTIEEIREEKLNKILGN